MAEHNEHSDQFKLETLRVLEIAIGQNPVGVVARVAAERGITVSRLYGWMKRANIVVPMERRPSAAVDRPAKAPAFVQNGNRREYTADFKAKAVEAVKMAIREKEPSPIQAVAAHIGIHGTLLRDWLCHAGYAVPGTTPSGERSRTINMEALTADALGQSSPSKSLSVPAAPQPERRHVRAVALREVGDEILTHVDQLERRVGELTTENERLQGELRRLRQEREVFIAASSILGQERRSVGG